MTALLQINKCKIVKINTINSRTALSFALNRISFFSANENGTVQQNNQSDFKAFLNSPITLQENKSQWQLGSINIGPDQNLVPVFRLLNCAI